MAIEHLGRDLLDKRTTLKSRLSVFGLNSLWRIISGEKLDYSDPRLKDLVAKVHRLLTNVGQVSESDQVNFE